MSKTPDYIKHLEILNRIRRREQFHDQEIESITAINKRVIIRLDYVTLIITNVTELKRGPLHTRWIDGAFTPQGSSFILVVNTDEGPIHIKGSDIRLIRNADLAILIPPVDT